MIRFHTRAFRGAIGRATALLMLAATTHLALAQMPASQSGSTGTTANGGNAELGVAVQTQQQLAAPGPAISPSSTTTQTGIDPSFHGSLVRGQATADVLPLGFDDAIQRGLQNNLGLILQGSSQRQAGGQRLEQLQSLLPTVTGSVSITVEQIDLAAEGLKFPGINPITGSVSITEEPIDLAAEGLKFPGINPIIGPFQVEDFRAYLTQNLVNLSAFENYLASKHNFQAAQLTAQDARDLVVLTVGNAYLLCVADEARIKAVQAELDSSKLSFDQARDAHEAGTSPRLDVLRAQVDYQSEQQTLIATTNQLAKDKLSLARAIGLPLDQKFELADTTPYQAFDTPDPDVAFQQALKQRKDLAAAAEQTQAAEAARKAAVYDQLPVVSVNGNFGDIGETVTHSHGTYAATGQISAPILQIARMRG
jgi:outer membrane protein TolC